MKTNLLTWSAIALAPAAALVLTACKSEPKGQGAAFAAFETGVPGGVVVQTYQTTATVTGIDAEKRKLTLASPDGKKTTFKAGPEVVNFDQIRIGDQVKANVTEELVVFMASEAPPQSDAAAVTTVALAPIGAKPGALVADTLQVTAKVTGLDLENHKATLQFPDGTTKTFPVRPDVDLTQRKLGEDVVIRSTEAVALSVQKP